MSNRWRVLKLRAYRRGDEHAFAPRADMLAEMQAVAWEWTLRGPPGLTWTLTRAGSGEVVGIGGGVEQQRGDWQLWCVLAPLRWKEWPSAIACAVEVVRRLERDWGAKHLTALARDDLAAAALVLRRMGFAYYGASLSWRGYSIFERSHRGRRFRT